ncbi:MAG TPA: hypothetical protein VIJ94_10140 [Caulobacteraceae bacterium]
MRQFAVLALLSLAACGPTKQQISSQCEVNAIGRYPAQTRASVQLIADSAETCMLAHGLVFDRSLPGCTAPGVSPLIMADEAMCYRAEAGRPKATSR